MFLRRTPMCLLLGVTKGLTFKLWQIKFGSQSYLWVFDGRGVMGLWVAMGCACRGRHWSWVWWVLLATLPSTSLSHWWQLRFLGLIFGLLGLWSNHVVGLQIDFWISEIFRIYYFILFYFFAIGLIFGCMLIVVAVEVSFGLWWRQPVLIVGVVVAGWIYLWWLWVKRKRERE